MFFALFQRKTNRMGKIGSVFQYITVKLLSNPDILDRDPQYIAGYVNKISLVDGKYILLL